MKKTILLVFIIGLLIRLILLGSDYYQGDVNMHIKWAKDVVEHGSAGFYDRNRNIVGTIYPPVAIYIFALIYWLYLWLNKAIWFLNINIPVFPSQLVFFWRKPTTLPIMMKMPGIISDIMLAWGIYLIVREIIKSSGWKSVLAPTFILFNPAFIYNSSYWGQIDALPLALIIFSFYFLFTKKMIWSAATFVLAILAKQTVVIFIPLYFLAVFNKRSKKDIRVNLITILFTAIILFLPFYQKGNVVLFPLTTYARIATKIASQRLTFNAYNFWWLITDSKLVNDDIMAIGSLTIGLLSQILIGAGMLGILFLGYKRKTGFKNTILSACLIGFVTFLFSTRLHERHMMVILPFLLLAAIKDSSLLPIFIFTSLFHFFNLYNAWGSPYIPYLTNALKNIILVKLLIVVQIGLFFKMLFEFIRNRKYIYASVTLLRRGRDLNSRESFDSRG